MSRPRSAPFSTHSRGVPLFDRSRFLDLPRHGTRALLDLRDVGSSALWFCSMQSWLTLWSVLVDIVAVVFFYFYSHANDRKLTAQLDFTLISLTVVLPLVGFVWVSYLRRDRCLDLLSEAKCLLLAVLAAHTEWVGGRAPREALEAAQDAVGGILAAMHAYFLPTRFYSRSYPYLGYKAAMIQIALDRARNQRQLRGCVASLAASAVGLRAAGLPPALEAALHDRLLRLQVVVDQMSNVKEFGTPQGVRSLARFYVCLVIPLFFAPYWAWVGEQSDFALAFFLSIAVQIALAAVLNVALSLEDPFDNSGLDGIFVDEQLFEVEQALAAMGAASNALGGGVDDGTNGAGGEGDGGEGGGGGAAHGPPRVVRVATDNV